ncbi:MAG TPA: XdhC/CoxI family protein [Thermodesulfovibrionales bacterium]|nr:XdhC/CoxI family protein [Thermodesulfovibrionales bacterium]
MDIYEELVRLRKEGRASALATIIQCEGSSPQKEGSKMLVLEDGSVFGTLGGGCLEAEVIQACLTSIKDSSPQTIPFQLTEKNGGLVCGGKVLVYIEPIAPETRLVILGAGHVGKALSTAARFTGFRVTVIDDREEFANRNNMPDAHDVVVADFGNAFSDIHIDKSSCIVIATRGHNHDLEALKSALDTEAGYIGLLGSRRKKALLFGTLKKEGIQERDISRIVTPVGLPIGSVTPSEIAVSIMAQIIQHRNMK